jgi:hypothetical protein
LKRSWSVVEAQLNPVLTLKKSDLEKIVRFFSQTGFFISGFGDQLNSLPGVYITIHFYSAYFC